MSGVRTYMLGHYVPNNACEKDTAVAFSCLRETQPQDSEQLYLNRELTWKDSGPFDVAISGAPEQTLWEGKLVRRSSDRGT